MLVSIESLYSAAFDWTLKDLAELIRIYVPPISVIVLCISNCFIYILNLDQPTKSVLRLSYILFKKPCGSLT